MLESKTSHCDFDKRPFLRDSQIFRDASWAYKHVGLVQKEKKQKRNQTEGIILGAGFDGMLGRVMASRSRILILILITPFRELVLQSFLTLF